VALTFKEVRQLFQVPSSGRVRLRDYDPGWAAADEFKELTKDQLKAQAAAFLEQNVADLAKAQERLYASDTHSVLIVLQASDAAGKDGTIKHVMSGVNPQGCQIYAFKKPSSEELDHNFLWRYMKALPERGRIGIFNRSYYEDVLVVRVHPELLGRLPDEERGEKFWQGRYDDINAFERHLARNGTLVLKFFLHISKEEQRQRFLARLDEPAKRWKFEMGDVAERKLWDKYMHAYEDAIRHTSRPEAPWHVVPADNKRFARLVIAESIVEAMENLDLQFPKVEDAALKELKKVRRALLAEAPKRK